MSTTRSSAAIHAQDGQVIVSAGEYTPGNGKTAVRVAQDYHLNIAPATSMSIVDEVHELASDRPVNWWGGTHLSALQAGGTALPGCLVPGSVIVKLPDGTVMSRDKDYFLEERWAGLSRLDGGRIPVNGKVAISYRIGLMRLDTIAVDPAGSATIVEGKPAMKCPKPPSIGKDKIAIANVFMPYNAKNVASWQIFSIGPAFAEPDDAEMERRSKLVPKTLAKLRAGKHIMIVTWGDSVTAGGDALSHDKMFAELFPAELQKRFPAAKVSSFNAGIGATNTDGRLPGLQKDVLDHHPDLVTIEFVNDMGLPDDRLRQNYHKAFAEIHAAGAEAILITPHFTMPEMMNLPHPRGKETRHTVELLRQIAADEHVALADTSKRWEHLEVEGIPYTTLLDNGINHPDDRGHAMFVADLMTFFPK